MRDNSNFNIKVFSGKEGFLEILPDWQKIIDQNEKSDISHLPEWYLSIFNSFSNSDKLFRFIVLYENGTAEIILPVKISRKKYFGLTVNTIELINHGHFIYRDMIAKERNDLGEIFQILWNLICKSEDLKFDIFVGINISENNSIYESLNRSQSIRRQVWKFSRVDYIDLTKYDDIYSVIPKNFKKTLKKNKRKIQENGELIFESEKSTGKINPLFERFIELEASGWKGKEGTAIKCDSELVKFYKNLMENINHSSEFDIQMAKLNGKDIAGQLGIRLNDTFYAMKIGYDENFADYSPGQLLQEFALEKFRDDEKTKFINLMSGYDWHKLWTNDYIPTFNFMLFNRTAKGNAIYYIYLLNKLFKKLKKQHN